MEAMRPQVLIVEDDEDFVSELVSSIASVSANVDVTIARCREWACQLLDEQFFDFAILDLNIPTQERGLDADPDHGKFVFHHARIATPGTKLLVLTGSPSDDFIADMLAQKHDADIWSEGSKTGTVEFLRKIGLVQVDGIIGKALGAIEALGDVELEFVGVNLQTGEDRLVRILPRSSAPRAASSRPSARADRARSRSDCSSSTQAARRSKPPSPSSRR
jgi:CheY-like chemotaxis protein